MCVVCLHSEFRILHLVATKSSQSLEKPTACFQVCYFKFYGIKQYFIYFMLAPCINDDQTLYYQTNINNM